jgi:hypothetical protein
VPEVYLRLPSPASFISYIYTFAGALTILTDGSSKNPFDKTS